MMPIVHGLETEFAGRAAVLRLDANDPANAQLQQAYALRGHPTFAVLDQDGRVVQTFNGPQPESLLRAALAAAASIN